jgi:endonuclease/exonuclease/phosphatase (EEP) superfamily protein YafD
MSGKGTRQLVWKPHRDRAARSASKPIRRGGPYRVTSLLAWSYLAVVLGLAALLWLSGDHWWPATLFTFGPRWIAILPLPCLVPLALLFHRRALWLLAVAGIVVIGPIMGFCLSWQALWSNEAASGGESLRVLSCNNGSGGSQSALAEFIRSTRPDLIVLQEGSLSVALPPEAGVGWQSAHVGGVWIYSRFPIVQAETLKSERFEPWNHPAGRCDLETPWGTIHVVGVHLETPREGLQEMILGKWKGIPEMRRTTEIRRVESELASEMAAACPGPTIVAGDFNMPVDSTIYQRYWSSWQNAFSTAGLGFGPTKFTTHFGIRIDHILANGAWRVRNARIGPSLGGDHRPVVAELELR